MHNNFQPWDQPLPERITHYFLGLHLAQAQDRTALAVVERTVFTRLGKTSYACRELIRWSFGTAYPVIVAQVSELIVKQGRSGLPLLAGARLIVNTSGVGSSIVDMLRQVPALANQITRVFISAGHNVSSDNGGSQVPRKELIGVLLALMQTERLQIAGSLSETKTLVRELQTFKARAQVAGKDTLEDWHEREHEDLVLALAIPLWYAERNPPVVRQAVPIALFPGRPIL